MDASLLRCRSQWQICKDTVRFSTASAPVVTLIEKFLQEADPEYATYASIASGSSNSSSSGVSGRGGVRGGGGVGGSSRDGSKGKIAVTAQAAAMERRRKQKCPVQLHVQHSMLCEAYALLEQHLAVRCDEQAAGNFPITNTRRKNIVCIIWDLCDCIFICCVYFKS